MVSTVEKGDNFEIKAYKIIRDLLKNDDFFVPGKNSECFRQKKYPSHIRSSGIKIDLSIETRLPGADKYSILTIIECKDYGNKRIPVNDIEELASKIEQLGSHNTKGLLIARSGFQKSTLEYAKYKGIALITVCSDDTLDWISYRGKNRGIGILTSGFTKNESNDSDENLIDTLISFGVIDSYKEKIKYINFPYISDAKMRKIISQPPTKDIYTDDAVDFDKLCLYLKPKYNVSFDFETNLNEQRGNGDIEILGKIQLNPPLITISKDGINDLHRWRFTLAHEIGHLILHHNHLRNRLDEINDTNNSLGIGDILTVENKNMEVQANKFASELLMPKESVDYLVKEFFKKNRIHENYLYLDEQPCNKSSVNNILICMMERYNVSITAAKMRLKNLGYLVDKQSHFN